MMGFIPKRPRRRIFDLQLTSMIDIFSIVVIFLIKGAVFGVSDVTIPNGLHLPLSVSKESLDTAPQVTISSGQVSFSVSKEVIPVSAFKSNDPNEFISSLRKSIGLFIRKVPAKERAGGVMLNVVADQSTPYEQVYDVVKLFREEGFESVLFIASAEEKKKLGL
jgi:biopolymer transport protein ExbD